MFRELGSGLAAIAIAALIVGCGGSGSPAPTTTAGPNPASTPAPVITSVAPSPVDPSVPTNTVIGSSAPQNLSVRGSGFEPDATVMLTFTGSTGVQLAADRVTFLRSTELTLLAVRTTTSADLWTITVTNPNGMSSGAFQFAVIEPPVPVSDGFDYPVGNRNRYSGEPDGDGWYVASDHNQFVPEVGNGKYHLGEDWNAEDSNDMDVPVYAVANGTVVFAGAAPTPGWGNVVILRHKLPDGILVESLYGHLNTISVSSGQVVRGEQIGTIGKQPATVAFPDPSPHLHLEIRFADCPDWGKEGVGYSAAGSPVGWTDPSDFIDAHRPEYVVRDGDFIAWQSFSFAVDDPKLATPGPGTSRGTAERTEFGGNPGAYLAVSHQLVGGDSVITGAVKQDLLYSLRNDGPISSITAKADVEMLTQGTTSWQFVIEQAPAAGQPPVRYYSMFASPFSGGWGTANASNLRSTNFDTNPLAAFGLPADGKQPDFSAKGQSMRFGFMVGNTFPVAGIIGTVSHRVDNVTISIAR